MWHRNHRLQVAHAPGIPGTFSPPPRFSDPDIHHGMCLTQVSWGMPGSLTSGFLWSRCRGKRSRYARGMRNPQFYVSGKRPIMYSGRYISWYKVFRHCFTCNVRSLDTSCPVTLLPILVHSRLWLYIRITTAFLKIFITIYAVFQSIWIAWNKKRI